MTNVYKAAYEKSRAAIAEFKTAQEAYRAQQLGDSQYCAAKGEYHAAMAELDKTFNAEAGRVISV